MTDLSRVHLIGIGGSGMSGVAHILLDRGATGDPVLLAAGPLIRLPGEPSEGVAPNDPLTHMNEAEAES